MGSAHKKALCDSFGRSEASLPPCERFSDSAHFASTDVTSFAMVLLSELLKKQDVLRLLRAL